MLAAYLIIMICGHLASALLSFRVSRWAAVTSTVLACVALGLLFTEVL
jgi:hypothetical protein